MVCNEKMRNPGSRKKALRDIKRKEKKIKNIKKHLRKLRTRTTYS